MGRLGSTDLEQFKPSLKDIQQLTLLNREFFVLKLPLRALGSLARTCLLSDCLVSRPLCPASLSIVP